MNTTTNAKVLFGDELHRDIPCTASSAPICCLRGCTEQNCNVQVPLDNEILSKHIMFLGGIGTGKTNAFYQIVSQLKQKMTSDDVMIIFDTKGDFYTEFYCPGDVVISNDNTATGTDRTDYWNLFGEIERGEHAPENVLEISKSIFAEACDKTNQIFFPNAAKDLFYAIVMHFLKSATPEGCTNKNLLKFVSETPSEELRAMLQHYPEFRAMSSYISVDDSPQTQGVISELQQVVRELLIGNFAKHGTISIRDVVRRKSGKTVFIEYDLSTGAILTPVYSLLFDLAIKEALGRKRSEGNVYFITDEFRLLPHLRHIDDAVNFGRSMGIKFFVGVQNVEQIYDNYGEERARSILSGFSTNVCFRVNDAVSREYIQGVFGKNQKLEGHLPTNQRGGIVETQREANVVEDWDITRLRTGQAIIGLPGLEPFVFQLDKY